MEETKKFYYATIEGKPIGTVCLIKEGDVWARGVAICSELDSFVKQKGRHIAEGRARKALKRKVSGLPIFRVLPAVANFVKLTNYEIARKSEYQPLTTKFEDSLIKRGNTQSKEGTNL